MEQVILVDQGDNEIGVCEKLAAHRRGELHRAFSVFVFNTAGQLLIQKRAETKYHTPGIWTNTCDGHPRPGETTKAGAERRLEEEMGIRCSLEEAFAFTYHAELDHDLIENEYDHVLIGQFDGRPLPNPQEYSTWQWIDRQTLDAQVQQHPDRYAPWLKIPLDRVWSHVRGRK
jgi:isopentenyl-diphosphate delta-isomerase